jgi:hypothetical protein
MIWKLYPQGWLCLKIARASSASPGCTWWGVLVHTSLRNSIYNNYDILTDTYPYVLYITRAVRRANRDQWSMFTSFRVWKLSIYNVWLDHFTCQIIITLWYTLRRYSRRCRVAMYKHSQVQQQQFESSQRKRSSPLKSQPSTLLIIWRAHHHRNRLLQPPWHPVFGPFTLASFYFVVVHLDHLVSVECVCLSWSYCKYTQQDTGV